MRSRACSGRSRTRFLARWRRGLSQVIRRRAIRFRRGRSLRRELWAMENALAADAPKLASMFEVFNLLTRYERPVGIEPLALSAPLRAAVMSRRSRRSAGASRQRRLAAIFTLMVLAVVAATCFAITTQVRPAGRACLAAASAGFGYTTARVPGCVPSPAAKK
jgi:hypothetical protein